MDQRRKITVFTPGKQYMGEVDVPDANLRTTDLLNSANMYWKDPTKKAFTDALLMYNVTVSLRGLSEFQKIDRVQIRQPNIIFYFDEFAQLGNLKEKKRADVLKRKTMEEKKSLHMITKFTGSSFFDIWGSFFGLFKSKSVQKYIPITDAVMYEVYRQEGKWGKTRVSLPNDFIGVNTTYIESSSFD